MNKKLIFGFIGFLFIMLFGNVSAFWIYQEDANLTAVVYYAGSSCHPDHPCTNAYDGDWNTYALQNAALTEYAVTFYFNYSKPNNALSSSFWKIKSGKQENISFTLWGDCFTQSKLQLRATSNNYGMGMATYSCYSGSNWEQVNYSLFSGVYEEAIWWNINDTIKPDINIIFPTNNTNWTNNNLDVNYTRSDNIGLASCWYSNDTYLANTTLPSCGNITSVVWSEALHNVTIWANDTGGNINSSSISFLIDTINPLISITYPSNNTNWSNSNLDVNFTRSDANLASCWYSNDTYSVNTSLTNCGNITSVVWTEGNHNVTIWVNDSAGNVNYTSVTFLIDTINPNISIIFPTNNTYNSTSTQNFTVNISDNLGIKNATLFIYNSTNNIANKTSVSFITGVTQKLLGIVVTLIDGVYNWFYQTFDWSGNMNTTSNYTLTIDSLGPAITINFPLSQNYNTNVSLPLNFSSIDNGIGTNSSWYSVFNSSGSLIIDNTTIEFNTNTSFNLTNTDTDYILTIYSNDTLGNLNYTSVTFGIRMTSPSIVLNSPINNHFFNSGNNIYINWTAIDSDGLDTFSLYLNGILNKTWIKPTNNTMNYTVLNLSEGRYNYTIIGNDTSNNIGWALNNLTFTVDLTVPNVTINSITTTTGSLIVAFNSSEVDNFQMECRYTVWNIVGMVDGSLNNISYSCSNGLLTHAFIVSAYGTYNLTAYGIDSAGNQNSTTQSFIVTASSSAPSGGGGPSTPQNQTILSFCGDNVCQKPNDYGIMEDFYTCPSDCQSAFNIDEFINEWLIYCLDGKPETICGWRNFFTGFAISNETIGNLTQTTIPFNLDTAGLNCFIGKPCYWESSKGVLILFGGIVLIAIFFMVKIPSEKGSKNKITIPRYFIVQTKKYKRKRR